MRRPAVVAGLDASLEAAWAAGLAWRLARAAGVPFHLVYATPAVTNDFLLEVEPGAAAAHRGDRLAQARRDLLLAQTGAVPPEALARLEVRFGRPLDAIVEAARAHHAGLIVLGGKRHHALGRWFGGSTVHGAVHRRQAPVLMAVGAPYEKRRVLAALDLSAATPAVLEAARQTAQIFGAGLRAVHVADPRTTASTAASVQRDLRALLRTHEGLTLRAGAAAPEIAREAREWQADLVVLGSSGQGWLSRLLVGSVAEELLANPPASLLLVPPTPVEGLDAALIRSAAQPAFAGA